MKSARFVGFQVILLLLLLILPTARGATVTWDGGGGNASWENAANWSGNSLPTSADDVVITGSGTIIFSTGNITIHSLQCSRDFTLSGGTLNLTEGASTVTGQLRLEGGTLVVRGATAAFTAGTATHQGSHLTVREGGSIDLPGLLSLNRSSAGYLSLRAEGSESRISLPALQESTVADYYALEIESFDGGRIEAPSFTQFTGGLNVYASGENSLVDLSGFGSLLKNESSGTSRVEVHNGATVLLPNVTHYERVRLVISTNGEIATSQIVSFQNAELQLNGTEALLPSLTNFANGDIYLRDGASLTLPGLTRLERTLPGDLSLRVEGTDSFLALPNVSEASSPDYYQLQLYAFDGGRIELPKLVTIHGAIEALADGENSLVTLPAFIGTLGNPGPGQAYLEVRDFGRLDIPGLTGLDKVNLTLRDTGIFPSAQLTTFRNADLRLDTVEGNFPALTNLDGSDITLQNGATLVLAGISKVTRTNSGSIIYTAMDEGSRLELPNLVEATTPDYYQLDVFSLDGGQIVLPALKKINGAVELHAKGANSLVDLPGFTGGLTNTSPGQAYITVREGGTVNFPNVTRLHRVNLTIENDGAATVQQLTAFTGAELTLNAVAEQFDALSSIDFSSLYLEGGAQLELPLVTSVVRTGSQSITFQARDAGSVLSLPNLTEAVVPDYYYLQPQAYDGAQVLLPRLHTVQRALDVFADGEGSVIDLTGLTGRLANPGPGQAYLEAQEGGSILIPNVTEIHNYHLTIRHPGSIPTAQLTSLTDSEVVIDGGNVVFPVLANTSGTEFGYENGGSAVFQPPADFVVTAILVPATVIADQPMAVIWEIQNQGTSVTNATWTDTIYLSEDAETGDDFRLGTFQSSGTLLSGEFRRFTNQVIFPASQGGARYLAVAANSTGSVFEGMNFQNNTNITETAFNIQAPDLVVDSVVVNPTTGLFGGAFEITFSIRNQGTAAAVFPWENRVLLLREPNNLSSATLLLRDPAPASLHPGAVTTRTVEVTIPLSSGAVEGNYQVAVLADGYNDVGEQTETNNTRFGSVALALPPTPDLTVVSINSPETVFPQTAVELIWTTTNTGNATAHAPWTEAVYLVNPNGPLAQELIGVFIRTNDMAAGTGVTRTQSVTLPAGTAAGDAHFVVVVDEDLEVVEKTEGNNSLTSQPFEIPAVLAFQLSRTNIAEAAADPVITGLVTRNGDRSIPLIVSLESSDSSELVVPPMVAIGPGKGSVPVEFTVQQDGIPDANQVVTVTVSVGGYHSGNVEVIVENSDIPNLTLELARASLTEGETTVATLSHDSTAVIPITVAITGTGNAQLLLPASVTIPAGESSVSFEVTATDDTRIDASRTYLVQATAQGFHPASAPVNVEDNDLPIFTLNLESATISEGAGVAATTATISRGTATPRSVVLELENSNPAAALVPYTVTIPAGQAAVSFPVGAVDNNLVDGPKTTTIRAFATSTGAGQRVAETEAAVLTVTDDDGPALFVSISKDLVAEGVSPAATVTISRNTATDTALAVNLASSTPAEATLPSLLVIPAGQSSASVPLTTIDDHVLDGNKTVHITASFPGFASGSATVVVTDIHRPDLIVTDVTGPVGAETEAYVNLSYRVINQGLASAGTNWFTRILLSEDPVLGDDTLLTETEFVGSIPPGQFFGQTRQVRMPQQPGDYWVIVTTDISDQIPEVLENNNTAVSIQPVRLHTAYTASVSAALETGVAGTVVPLQGQAVKTSTGGPAPFALVNIHIYLRGTKRVISALADQNGNFSATFTPLPGEAGLYEIGAAHPGLESAPIQDSFTLHGLRAREVVPITLTEGSSVTGQFLLENLGDLPLTGLTLQATQKFPASLTVTTSLASNSIPALSKVQAGYAISALEGTAGEFTLQMEASTAQGAKTEIEIHVTVQSLQPKLVARPHELVRGMKVGGQTIVEFDIVNEGGAASAPVNVSLPDSPWMHLLTPGPIPPIAPGATNRVAIQLAPPADLPLGAYTGQIAILSSNAHSNLTFTLRALSEARGDLVISAVDEYTFFAEGSPKVAGAQVTIRDAVTLQPVTTGVTDATGQFRVPGLMEGYYEIELKGDKHATYREPHLVLSGQTNQVQAFLRREAVRYIWSVVPTEIEDRTRITIETVYEAFVPMPVVTIDPPLIDLADFTAEVTQIDLKITNHGLIAAKEAAISFGDHPDWSLEPLIEELGDIPARSSFTVPLIIRRLNPGAQGLSASSLVAMSGGGCSISGSCRFVIECAGSKLPGSADAPVINASASGNCGGGGGGGNPGGGGPGSGGEGGMMFGKGNSSASVPTCDECLMAMFMCALDFSLPEIGSCAKDLAGCATDVGVYNCGKAALNCATAAGAEIPVIGTAIDAVECIAGLAKGCGGPSPGGGGGGGGGGEPQNLTMQSHFQSLALSVMASSGTSRVERAELTILRQRATRVANVLDPIRYLVGNDAWFYDPSTNATADWLGAFVARIELETDGGERVSSAERTQLLALPLPTTVNNEIADSFIARWNRTMDYWAVGITNLTQVPAGQSQDFIAQDVLRELSLKAQYALRDSAAEGYERVDDGLRAAYSDMMQWMTEGDSAGVCAHVRLRLEQEAVMTRDAFDATLEIVNDSTGTLENISVDLTVRHRSGEDATDLFAIRPPTLDGISAIDGTGFLGQNTTGKATWILVPTTDAALAGPEEFLVGGTLRYTDGQLDIVVPLAPASITVLPSPSLAVKYFHQRDVLADDPFTVEIEPSVPYSLAVMVQNNGFGAARNVRIDSAQPKIVENEKGLLADFKIIATEVAGQNLAPSLSVNFGQIDPGTNVIGRWLFTSTLLGGFIEYTATFQHLDGLGNKKLSLVEGIEIHELIQIVQADGAFADGRPDFLVNDIPDLYDRPDTLHLSDGSVHPVSVVLDGTVNAEPGVEDLEVELSVNFSPGWAYLRIPDPGQGNFRLVRAVRPDGSEVPFGANVWTTDRTFLGNARRPVVEHTLHLLDYNSAGHYTLVYAALPPGDEIAPESAVTPLPADSSARIPVQWSGQDNAGGSGVSFYDVYVSVDQGPFQLWIPETIDQSAIYQGALGRTYAFYSVATDASGNREEPPAAPDAFTKVTKINRAPTLDLISDRAVKEGETLVILPMAADPDGDELTFSLSTNAPAGMVLHPYTGRISWTTTEGSGPASYNLTLQVLDSGSPRLGATRSFKVTVTDDNSAPVILPIAEITANEGDLITFTVEAEDADFPVQDLTFSLAPGAPPEAAIAASTGVFEWRPNNFQGGQTHRIGVVVEDNGSPKLSTTRLFDVVVRDTSIDFQLALGTTNVIAGEEITIPIHLTAAPDVQELTFDLWLVDSHIEEFELTPADPGISAFSTEIIADGVCRVRVEFNSALSSEEPRTLANLRLGTILHGTSSVAQLHFAGVTALRHNGEPPLSRTIRHGRLFVIENEPLLDTTATAEGVIQLVLYGKPGTQCILESAGDLSASPDWNDSTGVELTNTWHLLNRLMDDAEVQYFRVRKLN